MNENAMKEIIGKGVATLELEAGGEILFVEITFKVKCEERGSSCVGIG